MGLLLILLAGVLLVPVLTVAFMIALPGMILSFIEDIIEFEESWIYPSIIIVVIATILIAVIIFRFWSNSFLPFIAKVLFIGSSLLGYFLCSGMLDHHWSDQIWSEYTSNTENLIRTITYLIFYSTAYCLEHAFILLIVPTIQLLVMGMIAGVLWMSGKRGKHQVSGRRSRLRL